MYDVTYNKGAKNQYCGPCAMSALTGFGSGDCAAVIRLVGGRTSVKGSNSGEVVGALRQMGMKVTRVYNTPNTVGKWKGRGSGRYLVVVCGSPSHWIAVEGGKFWDSGYLKGKKGAPMKSISRRMLKEVWKVSGRAKMPDTILKRKAYKKAESKRKASIRSRVKTLAKKLGATVEAERGYHGDDWDYKAFAPDGKVWVSEPFHEGYRSQNGKELWATKWSDRDDTEGCWELLHEMMSEGLKDEKVSVSLSELGHDDIRDSVIRILTGAPNHSYKKDALVGGVLRDFGVITRGKPRRAFASRINRVVGVLKRTGRVKEYRSKNVRVKLALAAKAEPSSSLYPKAHFDKDKVHPSLLRSEE